MLSVLRPANSGQIFLAKENPYFPEHADPHDDCYTTHQVVNSFRSFSSCVLWNPNDDHPRVLLNQENHELSSVHKMSARVQHADTFDRWARVPGNLRLLFVPIMEASIAAAAPADMQISKMLQVLQRVLFKN